MRRDRGESIIRNIKVTFWIACAFFFLNASTILAMPGTVEISRQTGKQLCLILLGLAFWVTLILAFVFTFIANRERRYFVIHKANGNLSMGRWIGLLSFFSNVPASVADSVMIASFVLLVILYCAKATNMYVTFVMLALFVFSFNMHAMLNGRIYLSTKFKRVRREKNHE